MRPFCWTCHRPALYCFCEFIRPFEADIGLAVIVHPYEVRSTVGTAWILRRSITNLRWFRSKGIGLDQDPAFLELLRAPDTVPLLLFPGPTALNLSQAAQEDWEKLTSTSAKRPLFIIIDGTWTQAHAMLRKSALLRSLPRVTFETARRSEYGFKIQPHPDCLSTVEGAHRLIEVLASRGWAPLPPERAHDRMIDIFRKMARDQLEQSKNPLSKNPRVDGRMIRRAALKIPPES